MKRLRSKITKRILLIVIIMGCSGIFLNGHVGVTESVHAQAQGLSVSGTNLNNTDQTDTMGMWQVLNITLKFIYLLIRPLLVIGGLALDNTLVYASVFHLDAPLRQFRNMMKNFANFTLGFMVLFAIIKSIFSNTGQGSFNDEKSPLGIIKVTLIAGILIQASRFLMAALVDVSTIATYAVGGLPLSVMKGTDIGEQRILPINSSIDLNKFNLSIAGGEEFKIWYTVSYTGAAGTDKTINISPCRVEGLYIVGREFGDTLFNNFEKFQGTDFAGMEVCALYGDKLAMRDEKTAFEKYQTLSGCDEPKCNRNSPATYKQAMFNLTVNNSGRDSNTGITSNLIYLGAGTGALAKGKMFFDQSDAVTVSKIIEESKGFVGPLVTIYSSLLHFATLTNATITSVSGTSGIFVMKALVAVALFIPLIALTLVLIARIGMLRLYIVGSPFIILKNAFKIKMGGLDKYFEINNVIGIIFAPVVTVAALSLSLIFMTALVNGFSAHTSTEAIHNAFGIEASTGDVGNDAITFGGIAQLEFSKIDRGQGMDWFSRLMVNCFGLGLMWMIFFAAIRSNELGEKIGSKVEEIGTNVFKTLPIIPIGKKGVGVDSFRNVITNAPTQYTDYLNSQQRSQVDKWMKDKTGAGDKGTDGGDKGASTPLKTDQVKNILNTVQSASSKDEATKNINTYLKNENITTGLSDIGSVNANEFYKAINDTKTYDPIQQQKIITNLPDEFKSQYANLAEKDMIEKIKVQESKIAKMDEKSDMKDINTIFNTEDYRIRLDNYFNASSGKTSYTTNVGTKQITITRGTDKKYSATVSNIPDPNTPPK